mgnify:FL=1
MKWEEVRKIYPDQFVKVEILDSHIEDDKKIIDEIAIIEPVADDKATEVLLSSKDNKLVYHTSNDKIELQLRNRLGLRRVIK